MTDKGEMAAETIDKNMHIDTHYGAIASKAVKLKPAELNVPGSSCDAFLRENYPRAREFSSFGPSP